MLSKVKEELRQRHTQFLQQQQQQQQAKAAAAAAAAAAQQQQSASPQQPTPTPTPPVGSSMSPATPASSSAPTPGPPDSDMQESESSNKSKDDEKNDNVEKMEVDDQNSNLVNIVDSLSCLLFVHINLSIKSTLKKFIFQQFKTIFPLEFHSNITCFLYVCINIYSHTITLIY